MSAHYQAKQARTPPDQARRLRHKGRRRRGPGRLIRFWIPPPAFGSAERRRPVPLAPALARRVRLDLAAHFLDGVLDLPHGCGERFPDRDLRMLALAAIAVATVDDHLLALGHRDADPEYLDVIAVPVPRLRPVDDHVTAGDTGTEFLETPRLLGDLGSDCLRRLVMPEGDVDWGSRISDSSRAKAALSLSRWDFPARRT